MLRPVLLAVVASAIVDLNCLCGMASLVLLHAKVKIPASTKIVSPLASINLESNINYQ